MTIMWQALVLPVICWNEFDDYGRATLHTPVKCNMNYYHFAAEKIRDRVLDLMQQELEHRLHKLYPAP